MVGEAEANADVLGAGAENAAGDELPKAEVDFAPPKLPKDPVVAPEKPVAGLMKDEAVDGCEVGTGLGARDGDPGGDSSNPGT